MGQLHSEISDDLSQFIAKQKIYFVGTATHDSKINISPKGMDSLKVIDKNTVVWLNVTGSGNETSAHIQENSRMTIMFCSFEGDPLILRVYGQAKVIHKSEARWDKLFSLFNNTAGARQIFELEVELVQTSCGMSVPYFDYIEDRDQLKNWAEKKDEKGLMDYWERKNQTSLDGKPTHIVEKNARSV